MRSGTHNSRKFPCLQTNTYNNTTDIHMCRLHEEGRGQHSTRARSRSIKAAEILFLLKEQEVPSIEIITFPLSSRDIIILKVARRLPSPTWNGE
jgi:hypothetical protein